jgi:hypothetical protein
MIDSDLAAYIDDRHGFYPPAAAVRSLRTLLRSKALPHASRTLLLEIISGSVPTPMWLQQHGWAISPLCEACQRPANFAHLWQGCKGKAMASSGTASEGDFLRSFLGSQSFQPPPPPDPTSPPAAATVSMQAWKNGHPAAPEEACFIAGVDVYTDGSSHNTAYPDLARAGSAIVQRQPDGTEVAWTLRIGDDAPRTAPFAEFVAVRMAGSYPGHPPPTPP